MTSTIPTDLIELKSRFETWRTNRKYMREPIPDELWNAAADLSRRYPPSLVGRIRSAKKRRVGRVANEFLQISDLENCVEPSNALDKPVNRLIRDLAASFEPREALDS